MGRRILTFLASISALISTVSAQITGGGYGYGSEYTILGMISHLIGVEIHRPYELLGVLATIGVMWVSIYIIFKIAIQKLDAGLDDDDIGGSQPFAEALGVADDEDRNILAVITLLVVLTTVGTGSFTGLIYSWQTLIILTFLIMLLAILILILVGGSYGIVGGTQYVRAAGKQMQAEGKKQVAEAEKKIAEAEKDLAEAEKKAEEDIEDGNEDKADEEAHLTEEQLEDIIQSLSRAERELDQLLREEVEELGEAIENLEEILDLLDLED